MINSRTINRRASPGSRFIPRDQEEFFINRRPVNEQTQNRRSPVTPLNSNLNSNNLRRSPVQQSQLRKSPSSRSSRVNSNSQRLSPINERFSRMNFSDGFDGGNDETEDEDEENERSTNRKISKSKSKKSSAKIAKKPNSWIVSLAYVTNALTVQCGRPVRIDEVIDIVRKNYPGKPPQKKSFDLEKYRLQAEERRKQLEDIDDETGSEFIKRADKSIREAMDKLNSDGVCRR